MYIMGGTSAYWTASYMQLSIFRPSKTHN